MYRDVITSSEYRSFGFRSGRSVGRGTGTGPEDFTTPNLRSTVPSSDLHTCTEETEVPVIVVISRRVKFGKFYLQREPLLFSTLKDILIYQFLMVEMGSLRPY